MDPSALAPIGPPIVRPEIGAIVPASYPVHGVSADRIKKNRETVREFSDLTGLAVQTVNVRTTHSSIRSVYRDA